MERETEGERGRERERERAETNKERHSQVGGEFVFWDVGRESETVAADDDGRLEGKAQVFRSFLSLLNGDPWAGKGLKISQNFFFHTNFRANLHLKACVNPASWLPRATSTILTQQLFAINMHF